MNWGTSAESLSTSRSRMMMVLSPVSKSTKVSAGQIAKRSSSRVTSSPGRSSNFRSTTNGCSWIFDADAAPAQFVCGWVQLICAEAIHRWDVPTHVCLSRDSLRV